MRALLIVAFLLALTSSSAVAGTDDASVDRAKACDARAKEKPMSEDQYRTYMKTCLASEGPPPEPLDTLRARQRRCTAAANAKSLFGTDRAAFMDTCVRKG
jgi:hypothetical protein